MEKSNTVRKKRWYQTSRSRYKGLVALAFVTPGLIYYVLFRYVPMWGNLIAFQDYNPFKGFLDSEWVGLENFITFFTGNYFVRLLKNTFALSIYSIVFGFPIPILFALLLYEVKFGKFRSVIQCISYFPHFISVVVICGLLKQYLAITDGIVNEIIDFLGGTRQNFLQDPKWFRTVYIASGIWQSVGWSSIIYYATLTSIDTTLFEAAELDGANRLQRIWHISLPCLLPTMATLLLMQLGNVLNVGFEKVLLLQTSSNYPTSDILSTYVYRMGIENMRYSFASAVGLFNNVVGLIILVFFNRLSGKVADTTLW